MHDLLRLKCNDMPMHFLCQGLSEGALQVGFRVLGAEAQV